MIKNWRACASFYATMHSEYKENPVDKNSDTYLGISKRLYEEQTAQTLSREKFKEFTIQDVMPIYKKVCWDQLKCERIPDGLDLCLFVSGFYIGVKLSAITLQKIIGEIPSGKITNTTIKNIDQFIFNYSSNELIAKYQDGIKNKISDQELLKLTTQTALKMI